MLLWRGRALQAKPLASRTQTKPLCLVKQRQNNRKNVLKPISSSYPPASSSQAHLALNWRQIGSTLIHHSRFSSILNPSQAAYTEVAESQRDLQALGLQPTGLRPPSTPTRVTATGRIIAIGDIHGDFRKAIDALRTAGLIDIGDDQEIFWTGQDATVVQLGDVLDRGDNEIATVRLLRNLDEQARRQGGAVYMLNGNHESLNVCGDFRYVTPGAFVESALYAGLSEEDLKDWNMLAQVRYSVYRPGGPMAMELSKNSTVLIVNQTAFAHGGLLPVHVHYGLERLNNEVSAWMRADDDEDGGKALPPFLAMGDGKSVMWNRSQSKERFTSGNERYSACQALSQALAKAGADRLVVGHTPQLSGANCECDGKVWRLDVGMSYGVLNRPVQVLEISKDPATGKDVMTILSDSPMGMGGLSMEEDGEAPF